MSDDLKEINDSRIEFLASFVLKTLKIKADKWMKMYVVEEYKTMVLEFVEKNEQNLLVFFMNASGTLVISYDYPSQIKSKACYFVKKNKEALSKDLNLREVLIYGDLSYAPVDQLSTILDELLIPIFGNSQNQIQWPKVVSHDINKHIKSLKNKTHVISGQMKGKTQLPIPAGAEKLSDEHLKMIGRLFNNDFELSLFQNLN